MAQTLPKDLFPYLKDLANNNNRDWFNEHKDRYKAVQAEFKSWANELHEKMLQVDRIEKMKLFRIYRDVRFSKNKDPYKNSMSGSFVRATVWLRGGYYFHLQPGEVFLGGGFWAPEPKDLKRIRSEIALDPNPLREIIGDPVFKQHFGSLQGDQVKTAPKGYTKDHPAIDLLRYKQYLLMKKFTNKEALGKDFQDQIIETFSAMRPMFDYMSEVLTTDSNGVPLPEDQLQ